MLISPWRRLRLFLPGRIFESEAPFPCQRPQQPELQRDGEEAQKLRQRQEEIRRMQEEEARKAQEQEAKSRRKCNASSKSVPASNRSKDNEIPY